MLQVRVGWLPHLADYEGLSTVFDITSFALALLLVFRTNACYARCAANLFWLLYIPMQNVQAACSFGRLLSILYSTVQGCEDM